MQKSKLKKNKSCSSKTSRKSTKIRKIPLNWVFEEEKTNSKLSKRIKKKSKKPFSNIKKIMKIIYRVKPSESKKVLFDDDIQEDLNILYLIILKLIIDNKIGFKSETIKNLELLIKEKKLCIKTEKDETNEKKSLTNSQMEFLKIKQLGSHQRLLNYFIDKKESILSEMKKLFVSNEFKLINDCFFSGLLNDNNSLYLFIGLFVKFVQREISLISPISKEKAMKLKGLIILIQNNFFNIVLKKKQIYKQNIKNLKIKKGNSLSTIKEISPDPNPGKINNKDLDTMPETLKLEYTSTFLKLINDNQELKTMILEFIESYFNENEGIMGMINETIHKTNKEKMNIIINLSRSLSCIKTNNNDKIFSILKCLFQSNDLLRPVSFPEIKDAFLNVYNIIVSNKHSN
jgi:hypothetical protein